MIELREATKVYGSHTALSSVTVSLDGPGIIGLLGPNGSGKTTTLRLMAGFFPPTSGSVLFDGRPAVEAAPPRVGYLPEVAPVYPEMTVSAYLMFVARIKGMSKRDARTAVAEVTERLSLASRRDSLIGQLSRGYRQRVGIAHALVHRPTTLLLDEPTAGLDPVQIEEARAVIREAGRTATVVMSTHLLAEVETLCRRVVVLRQGELAGELPLEGGAEAHGSGAVGHPPVARRFRLTVVGDLPKHRSAIAKKSGAEFTADPKGPVDGAWIAELTTTAADGAERIVAAAIAAGLGVRGMEPARLDLFAEYARLQTPTAPSPPFSGVC